MKSDFLIPLTTQSFKILNEDFEVLDYTDLIDFSHIFKEYEPEAFLYEVSNDERIEVISYNLYESSNYWDFLLLFNNIKNWRELPRNNDKLIILLDHYYNEWNAIFGKYKTDEEKEAKRLELENYIFFENEKYRKIKYLPKETITIIKSKMKDYVEKLKAETATNATAESELASRVTGALA